MKLFDNDALARGAALVDLALADEHLNLKLDVSDHIGIVAAYIARGRCVSNIESDLTPRLGVVTARTVGKIFDMFEQEPNRLWRQIDPMGSIRFVNRALHERYPQVNEAIARANSRA